MSVSGHHVIHLKWRRTPDANQRYYFADLLTCVAESWNSLANCKICPGWMLNGLRFYCFFYCLSCLWLSSELCLFDDFWRQMFLGLQGYASIINMPTHWQTAQEAVQCQWVYREQMSVSLVIHTSHQAAQCDETLATSFKLWTSQGQAKAWHTHCQTVCTYFQANIWSICHANTVWPWF